MAPNSPHRPLQKPFSSPVPRSLALPIIVNLFKVLICVVRVRLWRWFSIAALSRALGIRTCLHSLWHLCWCSLAPLRTVSLLLLQTFSVRDRRDSGAAVRAWPVDDECSRNTVQCGVWARGGDAALRDSLVRPTARRHHRTVLLLSSAPLSPTSSVWSVVLSESRLKHVASGKQFHR